MRCFSSLRRPMLRCVERTSREIATCYLTFLLLLSCTASCISVAGFSLIREFRVPVSIRRLNRVLVIPDLAVSRVDLAIANLDLVLREKNMITNGTFRRVSRKSSLICEGDSRERTCRYAPRNNKREIKAENTKVFEHFEEWPKFAKHRSPPSLQPSPEGRANRTPVLWAQLGDPNWRKAVGASRRD